MQRNVMAIVALVLASSFGVASGAAPTGKLVVRVVDATTGAALPARLVLRTSRGDYPGDRIACTAADWPHVEAHGIFMPGEATYDVPPGETYLAAAHGLEYRVQSKTVNVAADKTTKVEFKLDRVVDLRALGWLAGDMHVHMLHGENQRQTSYEDVAETCAANGLDFLYVGQEYVGAGKLDLAGYHAACRRVSNEQFQMLLGGECPKSLLGHQTMMGVKNPFIIREDPPYFESHRKIHEQGGVVVYVHPLRYFPGRQYQGKWLDFPGNNLARELVFDAFAGPSFDGLSVLSDEPSLREAHELWFNLLNRGWFVPVFADSDACFDRPTLSLKAPGFWTTYFDVGPEGKVDDASLTEAVRKGRTFATTGPLVLWDVDGKHSGATLPTDGAAHTMHIHAWHAQHAFSLATEMPDKSKVGVKRIELVRNGKVVKTWEPNESEVNLEYNVSETAPCWYVLRVFGSDEKWQVALTSPIYFSASEVPQKRQPLASLVRGRVYDFETGKPRRATVEIRHGEEVLKTFKAEGEFRVTMPLDAEIVVTAKGSPPIRKNLLLDYAPVHHFMWYLQSADLAKEETLEKFEHMVRTVDLEFPVGYRLPGAYAFDGKNQDWSAVRVVGGPPTSGGGEVAVAALLIDAQRIAPGDPLRVAAVFHDEGDTSKVGMLVIEGRGYDPSRPTAYGAMKFFGEVNKPWKDAKDLGAGYRLVEGTLNLPKWVEAGPNGAIELSVRARKGSGDTGFIGLEIPLGETDRTAMRISTWPTMPVAWPDGHYGVGPLHLTNRLGREGRPKSDYRALHLVVGTTGNQADLLPTRDARGCADADDAMFTGQFFDQVLNEESHEGVPDPVRTQPAIHWRDDIPVIDATH